MDRAAAQAFYQHISDIIDASRTLISGETKALDPLYTCLYLMQTDMRKHTLRLGKSRDGSGGVGGHPDLSKRISSRLAPKSQLALRSILCEPLLVPHLPYWHTVQLVLGQLVGQQSLSLCIRFPAILKVVPR